MEIQESKKENKTTENSVRVFISKDSEAALNEIINEVNDGFTGKISRSDAANFILTQFRENLADSDIQKIRAKHFSVVAQMEAFLKKIKNGEKVPQNVMDAITESYFGSQTTSKRSKKPLKDNTTMAVL